MWKFKRCINIQRLKVLSYWNLNVIDDMVAKEKGFLKVLSYWNLNISEFTTTIFTVPLKVLSYWNLN